ncbi:hypothetical protein GQ600_11666 [Phytophthora cactorum]|nr:hypothetical protein GQ600_11666 [Phytophthora cactorum]
MLEGSEASPHLSNIARIPECRFESKNTCLHCGWSLGGVQDRYFRYESAGDQYLGRVVAGLPLNRSAFATLPPYFADPLNSAVGECVRRMFPALADDENLRQTLQLCVASLIYHADFLQQQLPRNHTLLSTVLFRDDSVIASLKRQIKTRNSPWMPITGIPPHIEIYKQLEDLKEAIKRLPDALLSGVGDPLDEKGVAAGNITRNVLEQTIRQLLEEAGVGTTASAKEHSEHQQESSRNVHFWGGKFHFLPANFEFPSADPLTAWMLCTLGYPPLHRVTSRDPSSRHKASTLSEWATFVRHVTTEIESETGSTMPKIRTEAEAEKLFAIGMNRLKLLPTIRARRGSQLKVSTFLRLVREAKKAANPNARSLDGDAVRARCISDGTVARYRSYINGIRKWVMANKNIINPQRFFDASGDLDPRRSTPKDFESFLVDKRETLKAGYNQKLRFGKALTQCLKGDSEASETKFYGTHSICKGMASFASGGSTGGPSIVRICLHCGWSLGGVQDRYFRYESAGDQYLGRVVAGLPLNRSAFATLPPYFADPRNSAVGECVRRMFPALADDENLRQTLQLCVASLIYHADFLQQQLPRNHTLLSTVLFRDDSVIASLKRQIKTRNSPWMPITGIPPHIEIYKQLEDLKEAIKRLPDALLSGVGDPLDEKGVAAGNITRNVLEQTIRQLLEEAGVGTTASAKEHSEHQQESSRNVHFWGATNFEFPSADPLTAWMLWWFGNSTLGYPPLHRVTSRDPSSRHKASTLSEWATFVRHVTTEIESETGSTMPKIRTEAEAEKLFAIGMNRLKLLPTIRARRGSQLKVSTFLRLVREAKKAANPNARSKRSLDTTSSQGNTRGHMNAAQPRGTPGADKLDGDAVRARCISDGTVARYRSYINGIRKWVMANKNIINPQRFFDASGDLDPRRSTPKDFESFLVDKRETLKAGYNQKLRFGKALTQCLKGDSEASETKFYGTHSICKGMASFASGGSTGGPSIVRICLHCGWSLGGVQDRYFRYESAGDQYLGRVVAGLPLNRSAFATLPPYFADPRNSAVGECVRRMFPALADDENLRQTLQLCVASLIYHADFLQQQLPRNHTLLSTVLFRDDSVIASLKRQIKTRNSPWMPITGIPPHIEIYKQLEDLKEAIKRLPDALLSGVGDPLDEKGVAAGNITRNVLEQTIRQLLEEAGVGTTASAKEHSEHQQESSRNVHFWGATNFEFPSADPLTAWMLWWFGNSTLGYPPLHRVTSRDPSSRHKASTLSEWATFVRHVTTEIESETGSTMPKIRTEAEAEKLFAIGMNRLKLLPTIRARRGSQLKVSTFLRLVREAKKAANPNARSKRSLDTTSSQGNTRGHMNAAQPRGTPGADKLDGDAVRARCISDGTVARYRSYINGIRKWVMANKNIINPQRFFDASGDLDPRRSTPKDFESFLVDKRETLKAGYNQKLRFGKALTQCLKGDSEASETKFYGTHSICKGMASFASGGSTGGPSIVRICLHCGWSLGGVQDRYFRYESAGDQYLGRVVAGLPLNRSAFATLPPYFADPRNSAVGECVRRMFPALADDENLRQTLQLCVASLIYHADFLQQQLPRNHTLLSTVLFRDDSVIASLKRQIKTRNSPWMPITGIPPHIEIYKQLEDLKEAIKRLPDALLSGVGDPLDEKGVAAGNITRNVLEQTIRQLLEEAGVGTTASAKEHSEHQQESSRNVHFWGDKFHFLPANFEFPSADPLTAWMLWWFGNSTLGYPPLHRVTSRDPSSRHKASTLSEWATFVRHVTTEIESETGSTMPKIRTEAEAEKLFAIGMNRLKLLPTIRARRGSQLKVSTFLRLVREAKKAANPNARSKRSLDTTSSQGNTRGHMNAAQPRGTPGADKLDGDAVRARCISDGTVARYRSYINGIRKWVMANKNIINPQRFFDASGDLDPRRSTPKDFESFLVDKRETLKAGYNQKLRFGKALTQCLKGDSEASETKFYGTHSICKGMASFASGGSTGGPSIVRICLHCGWSLGGVQDRYFRYESAGDQYLGRVVAGLPLNRSAFATLPPYFADPRNSAVGECVRRMFPALADDENLRQTLQLCVASLIYHADFLQQQLPRNHTLLSTVLFRDDSVIASLKRQIKTRNSPWMPITVGDPLDEKGVAAGNITRNVLEQTIRQLLEEAGVGTTASAKEHSEHQQESSRNVHFWGKFHFLPANFEFPSADPLTAWMLWWFGNSTLGYPPLHRVTSRDPSSRHKASTLSEWATFVRHVTTEIESETGSTMPKIRTEAEAENYSQ